MQSAANTEIYDRNGVISGRNYYHLYKVQVSQSEVTASYLSASGCGYLVKSFFWGRKNILKIIPFSPVVCKFPICFSTNITPYRLTWAGFFLLQEIKLGWLQIVSSDFISVISMDPELSIRIILACYNGNSLESLCEQAQREVTMTIAGTLWVVQSSLVKPRPLTSASSWMCIANSPQLCCSPLCCKFGLHHFTYTASCCIPSSST